MIKIPFHIAKNLGFGFLFLVLMLVLAFSYQFQKESANELNIIIDKIVPKEKQLHNINKLLNSAIQDFQIYKRSDKVMADDVLTPMNALRKNIFQLEKELSDNNFKYKINSLKKPVNLIRLSFYSHLDEFNNSSDPTNDLSVSLLAKVTEQSSVLKENLHLLFMGRPINEIPEKIVTLKSSSSQLLSYFDKELLRYLAQEHLKLDGTMLATNKAILLLKELHLNDLLPSKIINNNSEQNIDELVDKLIRTLKKFTVGLHHYLEEEKESGGHSDTLIHIEQRISMLWEEAALDLDTINLLLDNYVEATHKNLAKQHDDRTVYLLWIIGMAFIFVVIISTLLGKSLNQRIHVLTMGARAFAEGLPDHRIKLETKDVFAQLADVFNQMAEERKRYEIGLENERSYVNDLIENSMNMIISVDKDKRIVVFNQTAQETFGYNLNEVRGKSAEILYYDIGIQENVSQELLNNGRFSGEILNKRKNGEPFSSYLSAVVLYDEDGKFNGVVGNSRELTEEKEIETVRLQKDAAEAASATKSEFLANMSHEIRTPMNAIIGLSDLALGMEMTPRLQDYLKKISNASHSLLRIINDILDFSKIEAGKLDLESHDFLLRDLFDRLTDLFRVPAVDSGVELIMDVSKECRYVLTGDSLRLEQILINLLGNAIKFTNEGEVEVKVKTVEQLEDPTVDGPIVLEFSIRDTGIGMTEEQVGKLFQSFQQADSSTTRKYGGTGLGLTISKRLTQMMGGKIWLESKPSQGSTFSFTVRLERRPSLENELDLTPPDEMKNLQVLLVDDCLSAVESLKSVLQQFSFAVTTALSGKEAVDIASNGKYQLIIVDWLMPVTDGLKTVKQIKSVTDHQAEKPRIIMLTSFNQNEETLKVGKNEGVDAFLHKPVNCSLLFDTIMNIFGKEVVKSYPMGRDILDQNLITEQIGGARILLAEDNPINRQVAREILESVGLIVDMAEDGVQALNMVSQKQYDAVLMDIQMPQMDGLTATVQIRADERFNELPIIAMTAHAMAGDRDKSIAVGMNDHLAKPIDKKQLFLSLTKWIMQKDREKPLITKQAPQIDSGPKLPDSIPGIDLADALDRLNGNQKLCKSILYEFKKNHASACKNIRTLLDGKRQDDHETAKRIAHTVKGVSGNFSAKNLFNAAYALELGIGEERHDELPELLDGFESFLDEVIKSIEEIKKRDDEALANDIAITKMPDNVDKEKLIAIFNDLKRGLIDSNFRTQEIFDTLKPMILSVENKEEIALLEKHIDQLDFQEALEPLSVIMKKLNISL
ncbi:MAG: response regulator [Magnetococcales bacterium]|nr:response regulator [Magnetococcales bacterium]